jgi:predicted nuclease of predicted toxin-antitoxin system
LRLFLDAHISGPRIARALRERGYDVRAADEERDLDGLEDEHLLQLAADEGRVMITFDVKDFTVIARRWAEAGKPHAGLGIVVGLDHGEFGTILDSLSRAIDARPGQAEWTNVTQFIARPPTRHL